EGVGELGPQRRAADGDGLDAGEPEPLAELRVDELVGEGELPAGQAAALLREVVAAREVERPVPDDLLEPAPGADAEEHPVVGLLEHSRHAGEDGRLDL